MRIVSSLILVIFLFTSCAPLPEPGTALTDQQRADAQKQCIAKYTVGGALVGAIAGTIIGKKWEGAAVGAAAGGALAFALAYGHCLSVYSDLRSYPMAGAYETAQRVNYNPSQGYVTKIDSFALNPGGVAPGGKVRMDGSYYVMAPEGSKEVKVTETRALAYFDTSASTWKELGAVDQEVTAAIGTRRAEGSFDIPPDVPEGKYRITFKVASQGIQDQVTRDLTVGKGLAMGPGPSQPQYPTQVASAPSYQSQPYGAKTVTPQPAYQDAQGQLRTLVITSKSLQVMKDPSTKAQVLATAKKNETYTVVYEINATDGAWYKIRLTDGREGWVPGKHVKIQR